MQLTHTDRQFANLIIEFVNGRSLAEVEFFIVLSCIRATAAGNE